MLERIACLVLEISAFLTEQDHLLVEEDVPLHLLLSDVLQGVTTFLILHPDEEGALHK